MEEGDAHDCELDTGAGAIKDKKKRGVIEKEIDYGSESDPDADQDTRIRKRMDKRM